MSGGCRKHHVCPNRSDMAESLLHFVAVAMTHIPVLLWARVVALFTNPGITLCAVFPLPQMEKSFSTQQGWGMQQEGESDELKRVLLEGNPILLVGAAHCSNTSLPPFQVPGT